MFVIVVAAVSVTVIGVYALMHYLRSVGAREPLFPADVAPLEPAPTEVSEAPPAKKRRGRPPGSKNKPKPEPKKKPRAQKKAVAKKKVDARKRRRLDV